MMGVYPLNESVAIARSRDKLRSLQLLSRRGIGLPITGFAHSPDDIPDLIQMVNGAPLVIKVLEGTQGIGVVLCETTQAAESVIEAFMGLKQNIMVQEYISEGRRRRHSLLCGGRQGDCLDEAPGQAGRVPLQPAPGWRRQPDQDHPGRADYRHSCGQGDGVERGGC